LADVDLHLLARRRLEPHRRHLKSSLAPAPVLDRALHRPHAGCDAMVPQQPRHHHRVALGLAVEQPQRLGSRCRVEASRSQVLLHLRRRASQVALHRVARHAQLSRDALGSPAQLRQSPHLPDHLRRDHRHLHPQRCAAPDLSIHKNLPSSDCAEGVKSTVARGSIAVSPYNQSVCKLEHCKFALPELLQY